MLTSALARPAIAQKPRVLRFVPQGNLQNPDPIWTTTVIAANQGHDLGHAVRP
jgi:peptide/nickel transport system substrate-binding protein